MEGICTSKYAALLGFGFSAVHTNLGLNIVRDIALSSSTSVLSVNGVRPIR